MLNRGARLTELLKQDQFSPMAVEEQVVSIFAGVRGYLDGIEVADVTRFEREFLSEMRANHGELLGAIRDAQELTDEADKALAAVLDDFSKKFA